MQQSKSKQSGQGSVNTGPLAEAMSISEMKAKEAEEEKQRLNNPQNDPIMQQNASYTSYASGSGTCCIVL